MKYVAIKLWNYIEGINGLLLIVYSIFIFSTAVITSEHFSIYYLSVALLIMVTLSIIICPIVIRRLSKLNIQNDKLNNENGKANLIFIRILFFVIPLFFFLIYYFAYYPGGFSNDSISQYTQAINDSYNDWHPVIQTLLAFKLPLTLTGGWIGSITLFQIICFSAVLSYSFNTILKQTNLKYTIISMSFVLFNPQLGYIAMYPWKDVSFSIGALLLITYALQICVTKGKWIKSPVNTVLFIITTVLTTLFRHNAVFFTIPLIFAVLFYLTKKRGLIVCLSIIGLFIVIKMPLYSVINVENPGNRQVETLGLPMNIIGAVVTYKPETLDNETREFAYKIAPKEVWEEKYKFGSYNDVKWDDKTNNDVIEEYGSSKVISMMLRCFKNSKGVALTSLIKLTEASYTVSDKYNSIIRPGVETNEFNIAQGGNDRIKELLKGYSDFVSESFPHLFMYLGVMHLILIASILSKYKLNKLRDWKKMLFILPIFVYNYGTTFLLTGIDDTTRFFYYTFLLIPTLLVFLFSKTQTSPYKSAKEKCK
ncbi:MAG: hypothetical protein IJV39_00845 [Ruminococcus sp.]|nr:hypothetical protein [Ruminococcus sp.]